MEKKISKNQRVYPHRFGCSQNGGGTFSDFLIFFSPLLYLLITTSSSLKAGNLWVLVSLGMLEPSSTDILGHKNHIEKLSPGITLILFIVSK